MPTLVGKAWAQREPVAAAAASSALLLGAARRVLDRVAAFAGVRAGAGIGLRGAAFGVGRLLLLVAADALVADHRGLGLVRAAAALGVAVVDEGLRAGVVGEHRVAARVAGDGSGSAQDRMGQHGQQVGTVLHVGISLGRALQAQNTLDYGWQTLRPWKLRKAPLPTNRRMLEKG